MKWFYPFQKVVYISKYAQAEILEKLKAEVQDSRYDDRIWKQKDYKGKLELDHFEIQRNRTGRGTLSPNIKGTVTQGLATTTIEVVYQWSVMELGFYGLLGLLVFIFSFVSPAFRLEFVLVAYAYLYVLFVLECNRIHAKLKIWLEPIDQ